MYVYVLTHGRKISTLICVDNSKKGERLNIKFYVEC